MELAESIQGIRGAETFPNRDHISMADRTENSQDSVGILTGILANRRGGMATGAPDAYSNSASQIAFVVFLESIPGRLVSYN